MLKLWILWLTYLLTYSCCQNNHEDFLPEPTGNLSKQNVDIDIFNGRLADLETLD